jgi:hypothetical protein
MSKKDKNQTPPNQPGTPKEELPKGVTPKDEPPKYLLAKKRSSITTKAGILDDVKVKKLGGIDASYFVGGQDIIDDLVERGLLKAK